jgi:CRP-like cAMP-binding protein
MEPDKKGIGMSLSENEKRVTHLIDNGEKDNAVKLLFDMVVSAAKSGQFNKADSYRRKIMDINSMALTEIVNAAEIIEHEKAKAIDQSHKKLWHLLYDQMSEEEANAFYFSLKKGKVKTGTTIIKQGRMNNRLFFLDSGLLNIIDEKGKKQTFIKKVMPGEPVGYDTFFSISLATVTVFCLDAVSVHYLERVAFNKLLETFPGFDSKLASICSKLAKEKIEDILKKKSMDRRQHERFRAVGKIVAYPLDKEGNPIKTSIIGVLEDISQGGLGFSIRQSKQETARVFLGQKFLLNIIPDNQAGKIPKNGIVTSVFNQMFNNYTINFRFQKPLSHSQVLDLATQE